MTNVMSDAERWIIAAGFFLVVCGAALAVWNIALRLTARRMERRERHG